MRFGHEPADVGLLQHLLDPLGKGALRQPDAARRAAKAFDIMIARHQNLGAQRGRVAGQQRQQRVRGRAGGDFQHPGLLQLAEGADQVAVVIKIGFAQAGETMMVHPSQLAEGGVPMRAMNLALRQLNQAVQVPDVAILQHRVQQHGAQGRRNRERQADLHPVVMPAFHDLQQREVSLGDGFKEPVLLQEFLLFRMAHERQMRVQ